MSSQAASLGASLQMEMYLAFKLTLPPASSHAFTPLPGGGTGTHAIIQSQLREFIQLKTNHLKFYCMGFWLNQLPEPVYYEIAAAQISKGP